MPFPEYTPTTPHFLSRIADQHGDRTMIVLDDQRMSYDELQTRSASLAKSLLAHGLSKGARVGVMMPNGPDWVVAWAAATRIGCIVVPLNTFFQTRELAWILEHADVNTLLTVSHFLSHDYLERLEAAAPGLAGQQAGRLRVPALPQLRSVFVWGECDRSWAGDGQAFAEAGARDADVDDALLRAVEATVTPADPMVILYSSGSTADPKGAIHSHGGVFRHSFNLTSVRTIRADDRIWSPMPFFWVGGFVYALLGNMHTGATTLCEAVFNPESTLAFLERERVTVAVGWPHFGKALADHPDFKTRDLTSLRAGNIPDLLPASIAHPDPELRPNALGMTETCGPHTCNLRVGTLSVAERGTFGTAVEGVEHRIIDPESGDLLSPGEFGEICVRGYSLMQGLHKMERSAVFTPDGFYRTGDGGFFDSEGLLHFHGRLGEMIKSGGANVTPSEVEQVLVSYDTVQEAHVVGVDDPDRGQTVEAAVVLELGQASDGEALRARLKQEISAYKVPAHIFIFEPGTLPYTDTGKIDKRSLRDVLAERIARRD
jgi:acyl-CoA synthetase (AMP-forming)/AMP-acid ligase II